MSAIRRVAVVQRDVNLSGSLERGAYLLVRELLALGIETHVYCDGRTRTDALAGAIFHDVRPLVRSSSRVGGAVRLASFAAAATRAVRADRARFHFDVVEVNGVAGWEHDVVRVHEVVRATQRRWPEEAGAEYRFAHARAAAAPLLRPQLGVARAIEQLQTRPGRFAAMLAVSEGVRDDLVEELHVPADRVEVVPLPIELEPVLPDAGVALRERLGIARDDPVLLFVGHAFRRKGLPDAIGALAALPSAPHLVVLGESTEGERREAERAAAAARVAERVHFVGRAEPAPYYAAADILVLPTTHDEWGLPVIEAMAAGIPVVTTRAAGSAVELERAGAGIVVDGSNGELGAALGALLVEPRRRAEMGERGRRAAAPYTPRACAEQSLSLYERFCTPPARRRRRIATFPAVQPMNPYQRLLYDHLRAESFDVESSARFTVRWLVRSRRGVRVLHVHWPEGLYTLQRGPVRLRRAGSWVKTALFASRLAAARALGYRVAWTVHQIEPHRTSSRALDRAAARVLARAAHVLLAHDTTTRDRAASVLGRAAERIAVVPHGSYVGVYPPGRPRAEVRRELGVAGDAFVFLSFGELRANKRVQLLLRAFRRIERPDTALVVAGLARDPALRAAIEAEAGGDPRIHLLLGYVGDDRVAELFGAADVAVVSRDDGGTSGSLILPLSLGVAVVAADCPGYREITGGEEAGWLFQPGDEESLRETLERAASDAADAQRRGEAGLARARGMSWSTIASRTAELLREAGA